MAINVLYQGVVNGGLWYAIETGAPVAEIQEFANKRKTADYTRAKLGEVTAYDGETVMAQAEIVVIHNSDDNGAKTLMVSAQAKARAKLAGKVSGKRGGREIV